MDIKSKNDVPKIIWCCWFGAEMNDNRKKSLDLMRQYLGADIYLVTPNNISKYLVDKYPLHDSFEYLSDVHKSDYFRIYLWHHHGGGWHDIKPTMTDYSKTWDIFEDPNIHFIGKPEIKGGPAKVYDEHGRWMRDYWQDLVATNRWIGRAHTPLSEKAFNNINALLDENLDLLKKTPARHPYDRKRTGLKKFTKFYQPDYPLLWTVFGNIFHPLNYEYKDFISRDLPFDIEENLGGKHR